MSDDLPTGPEYVKFARTRNNMTQRSLATCVSVGYPHISKIETGKERPSLARFANSIIGGDANVPVGIQHSSAIRQF